MAARPTDPRKVSDLLGPHRCLGPFNNHPRALQGCFRYTEVRYSSVYDSERRSIPPSCLQLKDVLVALGGNALLQRGEPPIPEIQACSKYIIRMRFRSNKMCISRYQVPCSDCMMQLQMRHAREAATALKELVQHLRVALCVTHGNGPQVGLLALQVGHSAKY